MARKKTTKKSGTGKRTTKKAAGKSSSRSRGGKKTSAKKSGAKKPSAKKKASKAGSKKKKTAKSAVKKSSKKRASGRAAKKSKAAAPKKKKTSKKKAATRKTSKKKTSAKSAPKKKAASVKKPAAKAGAASKPASSKKTASKAPATAAAGAKGSRSKAKAPVRKEPPPSRVEPKKRGVISDELLNTEPVKASRGGQKLNAKQMSYFRDLLLKRRAELIGDVQSLETEALRGNADSGTSHVPLHMADVGSDTFEQDITLQLAASERKMLEEINAALGRIADGTYGICEETGKPISRSRLEAKPWARFCIEVARKRERGVAAQSPPAY